MNQVGFMFPMLKSLISPAYGVRGMANVLRSSRDKNGAHAIERDWTLFSFLTTEANDVVRPVHEKAMPVILIDPDEQAEWLGGGEASLHLQRPLPNAQLKIRETNA